MSLTRKQAAARLATEIGQRRFRLDSAIDEGERAFRSADLAILFLDNLDFIKGFLAGSPTGTSEISLRSIRDRMPAGN